MAINSKLKGNNFERECCKKLSLWLSENKSDDLLWRTASSGGRYTQRRKEGKETANQAGDITSTDIKSKFFTDTFLIECKTYKDLEIHKLLTSNSIINQFWDVLKLQARDEEKEPMLIVKQDRLKPMVIIRDEISLKLGHRITPQATFRYSKEILCLYMLDDLTQIHPKHLKGLK